jgi:chromosome segregation ATPase
MGLAKENESLKRQLEQNANARNQEILDLQHHFAAQLRELQRLKPVDRSAEIAELKQKISELESRLVKQSSENAALKDQVTKLEAEAKRKQQENDSLHYSLERARIEAMNARKAKQRVNYDELLAPLDEQLKELTSIIAEKQYEIMRLQKLVHKECQERIRLQSLLGVNPN